MSIIRENSFVITRLPILPAATCLITGSGRTIPELQAEFAFDSELAALIARLLQADRLTLLMDQWFRREAGSTNAAVWHHDEPYFDFVDGGRKCIAWFPLESASRDEGLTLIAGSHRWGRLFMAQNFGQKQPFAGDMSDYAANRETSMNEDSDHFLSWDMQPGDCLIFDFRTLHRALAAMIVECARTLTPHVVSLR